MNPKSLFKIRGLKVGHCVVCDKPSLFILSDELWKIRNHAICINCRSVARQRHIAHCIVLALKEKNVKKYVELNERSDISIYFAEAGTQLVRALQSSQTITTSEFFDDCRPGEMKGGIMCQDLQKLTFDNNKFDIVVTQDVFEHIQEWKVAAKEIHRVLKTGGAHVFSIPFYFTPKTKKLFDYVDEKFVPIIEPVEYHGDGIRGSIPAYNHFGFDMITEMTQIGYDILVNIPKYREYHHYGFFDCYTFIAFKRKA
jgi:SAM-dependent methyltransferase